MLTKDIKKTIDNARNVLVGKIPNPQAQIEQITIAMIYKFMDDMDIETVELGGNREFFVEELSEYAWSKIMSPQLGNEARMNLYTEALDKLQLSNRIPKLFRDIFKGAYLPFRDGQTLTLFLKEINDLSYSNSENLGNGFEYLLSIMGSQGDAGQFRTPRHIIDFIVDIVKPTKSDTILDPACGTAGFLISAYKYIQKTAEETKQPLTPQERTALTENIQGYDISPDMQKLALVNMYLHKFKDPKIYEYDTLTQDTRWDNYFDCILANPPFMTPKGGIQPHNRFGVKANRSEVLFVDYIMEHLNSTGRAGIIVPEGIVFQSANAYKELRKKLVDENYLYAVVSLPSGVFQPYSGVKTSILFIDRQLAKKTDKVLFVEIQNDGYDLGAQRREIDKNDIPEAIAIINQWQTAINTNTEFAEKSKIITFVEKSKLAENEEYNLTASRYKQTKDYTNCKWNMVKLGDICNIARGGSPRPIQDYITNNANGLNWLKIGDIEVGAKYVYSTSEKIKPEGLSKTRQVNEGDFILSNSMSFGRPYIMKTSACIHDGWLALQNISQKLNKEYLYYILSSNIVKEQFLKYAVGSTVKNLKSDTVKFVEIPLPPLDVQVEIAKELDGYQAIIDGAQKVIDNWKPTLPINQNWNTYNIEEIAEFISGITIAIKDNVDPNGVPILSIANVSEEGKIVGVYDRVNIGNKNVNYAQKDDLLFNWRNGSKHLVGKTAYYDLEEKAIFGSFLLGIRPNKSVVNPKYLWILLNNYRKEGVYLNYMRENINGLFNREELKTLNILLPSLEEQNKIIANISIEEKAIEECKKLIELHQDKINSKIKSIWGDGCE